MSAYHASGFSFFTPEGRGGRLTYMKKGGHARVGEIWKTSFYSRVDVPLYMSGVAAGFPSPAEDLIDKRLDLNEFLIKHPSATFFVRVEGTSMIDAGIHPGDILVVDRAIDAYNNCIAIVAIDGEFTVKRIRKQGDKCYLVPENPDLEPIEVSGDMTVEVWGVVTYVIHKA